MDKVVEGLFALAGVVLGAFLVVLFAVWRLRRERAYDRRLDWCESMMRELNEAGTAVVAAANRKEKDAAYDACWNDALQAYERLIPLCGQKEIYAAPRAIEAIQEFMKEFYALIERYLETQSEPDKQEHCDECINKLQVATENLSGEARKHLGMKPVPRALIHTKDRFVGSFRGRWTPSNR